MLAKLDRLQSSVDKLQADMDMMKKKVGVSSEPEGEKLVDDEDSSDDEPENVAQQVPPQDVHVDEEEDGSDAELSGSSEDEE